MAEWLADHPGLDSTSPRPVTIGGFDGFSVDLAVAPSWTKTCPFSGGEPTVPLFTDSDPASGFHWAIGPGGRARIYLVDLGNGRLFWADIEAEDDATFQAMLPEASAIVESIEFESPSPSGPWPSSLAPSKPSVEPYDEALPVRASASPDRSRRPCHRRHRARRRSRR